MALTPDKTDSPLIIDPNRVLALSDCLAMLPTDSQGGEAKNVQLRRRREFGAISARRPVRWNGNRLLCWIVKEFLSFPLSPSSESHAQNYYATRYTSNKRMVSYQCHSLFSPWRRALIGSIRLARRAGPKAGQKRGKHQHRNHDDEKWMARLDCIPSTVMRQYASLPPEPQVCLLPLRRKFMPKAFAGATNPP